ncbi:MAG: TetR/AcrR family transcriptional regulator [bacterium]|nr:TetR/AcrR family transcriptional regulator [bacterium]
MTEVTGVASGAARRKARPRKGSRDRAQVRRALLDAATRRFAESGFEGVNSNQIARDAGVGVGTFYNHFRDKLEVHQAVVLDTLEGLRGRIARAAAEPRGTIEQQVGDVVEAVVGFAEDHAERFRVAFGPQSHASRGVRAGHSSRAQVGYSTRATERRLAELQQQGALDTKLDPAVASRAFVAMQNDVVCWWLEDRTRASREAVIDTLIRLHPAIAAARR